MAADNYPHDAFFVGDEQYHRQAVLKRKKTTEATKKSGVGSAGG